MSNKSRPNILFLCADMIAAKNFGCYGDPTGVTPNIDKLGTDGTVFENAYASCPPCIPARVSMMCGQYARTHGKLAHVRMELNPRPDLIPEVLSRHGYRTGLIGKTHWWPADDSLGCDEAYITIDNGLTPELEEKDAYVQYLREQGLFDYNPEGDWDCRKMATDLNPNVIPFEHLKVNWTGNKAVELLEKYAEEDKPFFLFTSFVEPHTNGGVSKEYMEKFKDLDVPPPIGGVDQLENKPQIQRDYAAQIKERYGDRDPLEYKRGVYASMTLVDQNIGKILDKLNELRLAENTIILFTSDHGDLMYDHGINEKTFLYEGAVRIPMLVKDPTAKCGERRKQLVSHVDIMPTILDACGIDEWQEMPIEGTSMMPLVQSDEVEWRDAVYSEIGQTHCSAYDSSMIKMIRTGKWKYVYTLVDGHIEDDELYDLEADPDELINLKDKEPEKTQELKNRLMRWMVATEVNRIRPVEDNARWNIRPYQVPKVDRKYF
ncbi:MAG: sulfatase family protein [Planctomycetota bacterium]|jgi:arylsulfatase A-like enzyme